MKLQQTAPLLNGAVDPRLEMRLTLGTGEGFTMGIENINLELVRGILLHVPSLFLGGEEKGH